jgi:hypothetical protein
MPTKVTVTYFDQGVTLTVNLEVFDIIDDNLETEAVDGIGAICRPDGTATVILINEDGGDNDILDDEATWIIA